MLNWFYDTPIVRAVLEMEKKPIFKTKTDFAKREQEKRERARIKRKKRNKLKKRLA